MHLLRVERTAHSSADWFESVAAADAKNGSPARCWMAARGRRRGEVVGGKECYARCAHFVGL